MSQNNPFIQIEGYDEIRREIEVLSKYGADYADQRGAVNATVDLYHPKVLNLWVSEIIEETPLTKTLRMVPENGYLPPFQAGQYINLFVETQGVRSSRPYSIAQILNQSNIPQNQEPIAVLGKNRVGVGDDVLESDPLDNRKITQIGQVRFMIVGPCVGGPHQNSPVFFKPAQDIPS